MIFPRINDLATILPTGPIVSNGPTAPIVRSGPTVARRRPVSAVAIALVAVVALFLAGCSTLPQRPPAPTLPEIVQLSKEKVPDEEIIGRLRASGVVYRLQASDYAKLRADGVSDAVIDFMFRQQLEQARYEEWLIARDQMFFGPYGYRAPYPYLPYTTPFGPPLPFPYGR